MSDEFVGMIPAHEVHVFGPDRLARYMKRYAYTFYAAVEVEQSWRLATQA